MRRPLTLLVGFMFLPLAACGQQGPEPLSIQAPPPRVNANSQLSADVAHYHEVRDSMLSGVPVDFPALRSVMTDDAALVVARSLEEARRTGLKVDGESKRRAISSVITSDSATYTECIDNRGLHLTDQEATADQAKSTPEIWKLHLIKKSSRWKVSGLTKERGTC